MANSPARVVLHRGKERRLRAGHLWVYAGEIAEVPEGIEPGGAVDVADHRGRFIGRGYYNPASTIAVRILTHRRDEAIDGDLIRRRIARAVAYRRRFYDTGEACRMVFSEGDRIPGLTVDRYGSWLVLQISTLGMDRMRDEIVSALQDALHPRGIYERSDLPVRAREGLEPRTGVLLGEVPEFIDFELDGLSFLVEPRGGQKTGMYLDHRFNRIALQRHAARRKVLDVFCNFGAFGLYALRGGAESVTGIDWSEQCIDLARRVAERNGLAPRCQWIAGNAFDHMRKLEQEGQRFDLIVLDPPAFTKSARAVEAARRGYKEINLRSLRLAEPGAVILTASCSYHLSPEEFLEVVREAAVDAGCQVSLVEMRGQAPDHPVNLAVPETRYLKCAILSLRE